MGKGLSAAAGMGRVRNALRALALTDPRPAAVLAGLDRLFTATELDEQVTTVAYLVFDPVSGEGLAGNAGHPPPLLMSRDAPPRLDLGEAGTPLGWASPRQQYVFRLPPGHTAVLYSDGLVENRRAGCTPAWTNGDRGRAGGAPRWRKILPSCWNTWLTGCLPVMNKDDVTSARAAVPRRDG
jgi:serine phosphatase RsbU (regulator of sigma subunit)